MTTADARAIAPDLARGLMLLLIALANMPWHLWGRDRGLSLPHETGADGVDLAWQLVAIVAVDGRSYPLFAFLFGYGIWQLRSRQVAAGVELRAAHRLLQRRHWWMLAFGAVHALLLWMGDIVGAYGLIGLIVTWLLLERGDRTLMTWAAALTGALALGAVVSLVGGIAVSVLGIDAASADGGAVPDPSATANGVDAALTRLVMWAGLTPAQGLLSIAVPVAVLLAIMAARRGILEHPGEHLRLLRRAALLGIGVGWAGGAVSALDWVGRLGIDESASWATGPLHALSGLACGVGYAAAFGLLAARIERVAGERTAAGHRPIGVVTRAIMAVGKRSLSCYVAQSLLMAPLLDAWGFGLGGWITVWQGVVIAVAAWIVTVVLALVLEARGLRGPLEWLLRRLAYRGDAASQPTPIASRS